MVGSSGVKATDAKTKSKDKATTPCFVRFERCTKGFMILFKNNSITDILGKAAACLFLLFVLKNAEAFAQTDAVDWHAEDSTMTFVQDGIIKLYGQVEIKTADILLTADRVVYNTKTGNVCAYGTQDSTGNWIGKPVFTQGNSTFTQDSLCYNFKTQKGFSRHSVTQEGEIVFHADKSKRHPTNEIHVQDGKFTTCDAENPHFHFHLKKAILLPDDKVVSGPLYMKFRKIPTPLALPFAWFPMKQDVRSHGILMPSYGDGNQLGFFLKDLGYYLPIGDHWDTRVLFDIYTGGSWGVKNISQYNYRYQSSGNFEISYNRIVEGFRDLPGYEETNNFFVKWNHIQDPKARPNQNFSASLNFGSTGNFQQNLNSSLDDYLSNTFQSSIQWNYTSPFKPYSIATSAGHSQNSITGLVTMTLPEVTFTMSRRSMSDLFGMEKGKSKLLDDITVLYNTRLENVAEIADSSLAAFDLSKLDISNGLKHNVVASTSRNFGFLTVAPKFTYDEFTGFAQTQHQWYLDPEGEVVNQVDTITGLFADRNWSTSVSANTRFYGMFNFDEKRKVKAIRHVIAPSLTASYEPERSRLSSQILGDEEYEWNPWEASRFTPVDRRESGAVSFSVNQNLEAKVAEGDKVRKVKIIDSFTTSTKYNFLADSLQLSDVSIDGFTSLLNKVDLNVNSDFSAYAQDSTGASINEYLVSQNNGLLRLKNANASLGTSFNGGKDINAPWKANVSYTMYVGNVWDYSQQQDTLALTHSISVNGNMKILKKWTVNFQSGYDLILKEFTPTQLDLHWDLHCWELSFNWIPIGVRKSFALKLNIKSPLLKDVKFEARGSDGQLLF